jgi:hypothetical protein
MKAKHLFNIDSSYITNLRVVLISFVLFCLMVCGFDSNAQSRKRLRELEKMEESHETEEETSNAEGIARHMSIQHKKTRKEMKRYKKLNKQYNNNKRPLFRKRSRR